MMSKLYHFIEFMSIVLLYVDTLYKSWYNIPVNNNCISLRRSQHVWNFWQKEQ